MQTKQTSKTNKQKNKKQKQSQKKQNKAKQKKAALQQLHSTKVNMIPFPPNSQPLTYYRNRY